MKITQKSMGIDEFNDLQNAIALKEELETQKLMLQYVALMNDIDIPIEEGSENSVSNIDEVES